jgi:hypothetical protein
MITCRCKKRGCRRGRPLCRRKDNPRNVTCTCDHYDYPHRMGAGRCVQHPEGMQRMWAYLDKPVVMRKAGKKSRRAA